MGKPKVLIVSNRLPVNLVERDEGLAWERSIGGVATALDSVAKRLQARWVGWTGFTGVLPEEALDGTGLARRYVPIQASEGMLRRFYDRFSNRFLWPVMHGKRFSFKPTDKDWAAYQTMNRRFAGAVAQVVGPNDLIWVQDYHLMLLPAYLRGMGITNRIGYFLHVPFPLAQYWATRPHAQELAQSIAQADLIGLQTDRDARRFREYLREAGVRRVRTPIRAYPIGVDYDAYHSAIGRRHVQKIGKQIQEHTKGKTVIFSLSRMDLTKGILTQLRAVRRFLRSYKHREKVLYKLVVAPSREHLPEYTKLKHQIRKLVDDINASLGTDEWQPIDYEYRTMGFDEVTAWYINADFLLLLPDADGMNLIAKEYVAAHPGDSGMPVLSQAIGSAGQLKDAVFVPAGNVSAGAKALRWAFRMPAADRPRRWEGLRKAVRDQDIYWWADSFLEDLANTSKK